MFVKTFLWDETCPGQPPAQPQGCDPWLGTACACQNPSPCHLWGQPGAVAAALLRAGDTHERFAGRFGAVRDRFGALQVGATPGTAADPDEG